MEILPYIGAFVGIAIVLFFIAKRRNKKVWPSDRVVLHQFARGPRAPSLSPYCLKLETFLRMADIPYVTDNSGTMSSKGKVPWITYNGTDVADSYFCMQYLNKKFDVDLNKHLAGEEKAIARAFTTMMEDNFQKTCTYARWVKNPSVLATDFRQSFGLLGVLLHKLATREVRKALWYDGMSRHSEEEVMQIAETDLRALSEYLGTRNYLGGYKPCEVDCSVFGILAQCVWHQGDSAINSMIKAQFTNLLEYCERVKKNYWPDWDECITHNYTVKPKK